ncbi:MAG: hypothetical protein HY954_00220 [Deltaproteobacteria bacterium]|nr:hypothetical protein [Deltaproteobacteria bacterium]
MKTLYEKIITCNRLYLVLLPLGLIIYSNALFGDFVFDDRAYVTEAPWIRSLWNFLDVSGVRYAGDLSFALNYKLSGLDPFGYHLVNILIHIANSALVFKLIKALFETPFIKTNIKDREIFPFAAALATSVYFLTHPVQTQAVSYISQRYTSLATLFYLLSLVLYLKARTGIPGGTKGRLLYAGAVLSAVLAMKSKEISFTLPFILTLVEFSFFPKGEGRGKRLLPFFLTLLIIPLSMVIPGTGAVNTVDELMRVRKLEEAFTISRYNYLITEPQAILVYLRLLILPVDQHFTYYFPLAESVFDPGVSGPLIAVVLFIGASIYMFAFSIMKGNAYGSIISFGVLWFFITLSVESSVIPIRDAINEHRVYLPSAGIMLSFVTAVLYMEDSLSRGRRKILMTFLLLALAVPLSFAAYFRNELWRVPLRLYEDEVKKNPYSVSPHMYLGMKYYEIERHGEALEEFKKAEEINPKSRYVRRTLVKYYDSLGMTAEAIGEARILKGLDPGNPEPSYNLGVLYMKKGLKPEAEAEFKYILARWPDYKYAEDALKRLKR